MLADASVARNFAVLDWIDELIALAGGTLFLAHGVLGLATDEVGEIERIRAAFDNDSMRSPGSPAASAATAALVGLDDLIRRRSSDVTVLVPTAAEMAVAVRLQDPKEGTWRQSLGVRARRLDAGEAVSIGIATARGLTFASDDDDGRAAYLARSRGTGRTVHRTANGEASSVMARAKRLPRSGGRVQAVGALQ